ncbi:MAG: hypothetical protein ACETWD_01210 [Desulfatiglandales bacterium]
MKLTKKQKETIEDLLGEGFHTAFRKASESKEGNQIWHLIKSLPDEEWGAVIDFVSHPLIDYLEEQLQEVNRG